MPPSKAQRGNILIDDSGPYAWGLDLNRLAASVASRGLDTMTLEEARELQYHHAGKVANTALNLIQRAKS
ncbi:MAG: hypothetical protein KGJ86_00095 [Chloroflexota bacterium]|nr:hypothetical protein [Chloroflexota bacterium]